MLQTASQPIVVTAAIKTAARHSAVYGLGSILAKTVGFLMIPFYTHYLRPVDYGILEILDLSMSVLGMFLNMGMTAAFLRSYAAAQSAEEQRQAVSTAFAFVAATGALTYIAVLGFLPSLSALLLGPSTPSSYVLLSFSSFILSYIANLPRCYLRALEASGSFVLVETLSLAAMLVLNVYFIAVLKTGLAGILLSSLLVSAVQAVLLSAWTIRRAGLGFSMPLLQQMAAFGAPLVFSNLAMFTLNFSDRFFLQHLGSLGAVGIYAVGYKFGFMINYLLVQPFYIMWQSRMYMIHAQPDRRTVLGQMFVLYSLLLVYAGLALSLLSPEIVRLMVGSEFASSQEVIPLVAFAYIFCGIGYYVQVGLFVTNNTRLIGLLSAAAAALNLALNYVLIGQYGMLGAAWATLLSFLANAGGSYWLSQRVFPLPLAAGRVSAAIAFAAALCLFSPSATPGSMVVSLAMKAAILAAFPIVLWKVGILSKDEMGTLICARDSAVGGISRFLAFGARREARL